MSKKNKLEYILLSIIFLVGFAVRIYKIDNPIADWHSWRQADTSSVSRIFYERGINMLLPRYQDISSIQTRIKNPNGYRMVEFPLFNLIHVTLYKHIGYLNFEEWGRMVSVIFSLFSGFVVYLIVKKHIDGMTGVLASFFFIFLPYNIFYSRVILPEQMGMFFALLGIYLFDINIFISAVVFSIALLVKPFFAFYLIPFLILTFKKKIKFTDIFKFTLLAFTPFVLWRLWISQFPEGIPLSAWMFNGDRIRFHPSFFRWIFYERLTKLILGFGGAVIFVVGVIKSKSEFIKHYLLGILLYVCVVATANVKHDYYQIMTIPSIAMMLAIGFRHMNKYIAIGLAAVMIYFGWMGVRPYYQINHPEILEAGEYVKSITQKDDFVVAPYNGDTAFLYATGRSGWPAIDDSIENIVKQGADYYVSIDLKSADTQKFETIYKTIKRTDKYIVLDLNKKI